MTDRRDLELLFDKKVSLPAILRLMGKQVSRHQIQDLLRSGDLEGDLRKLLS